MDYLINPAELASSVPIPAAVADRYLKFAKAEHVKVLIYIFRKMTADIPVNEISEYTGVDEYDVKEALLYWADTGILIPKENTAAEEVGEKPKTSVRMQKPSRSDVVKRGSEDPKIVYLLRETQLKFGRNLKSNETATLVWLYDDLGLDVSIILFIVQYAADIKRINMSFIEAMAVDWVNRGIDTIGSAEKELVKLSRTQQCWNAVCAAFGLEKRKPSKKEEELSYKWIAEWELPKELLTEAYEECVNKKSKFSFAYTARIIENWYLKGVRNVNDLIKSRDNNSDKTEGAAYDLDLYEKLLNSKD